jgi:hypothetical protein
MSRTTHVVPLFVLALAVACTDNAVAPLRPTALRKDVICTDPMDPTTCTPVNPPPPTPDSALVVSLQADASAVQASLTVMQSAPPTYATYDLLLSAAPTACNKSYTDCLALCLGTRIDFNTATGKFWSANSAFWSQAMSQAWYQLPYTEQDMKSALQDMKYYKDQFQANDCNAYISGGSTPRARFI